MASEPHKRIEIPTEVKLDSGLWVVRDPVSAGPAQPIPDGSLLVVGEPPNDFDAFRVVADLEALGMPSLSLPEVEEILSRVRFEIGIVALSALAAGAWFAGTDQDKHLQLADEVFGPRRPVMQRLRAFLREDRRHVIFSEQHIAMLMRLLILGSSPDDAGRKLRDAEADGLLMALLGIAGHTARDGVSDEERRSGTEWVPWMVRSGLYFAHSNLGSDQGRGRALFVNLSSSADPDGPNWCDLERWMEEDLASFDDQITFAYGITVLTGAVDDEPSIGERLRTFGTQALRRVLSEDSLQRLLSNSAQTRAEMRERMRTAGTSRDHLLWDRMPFEQRPLMRLSDGNLILLSPRYLHAWMGEGFYYRLLDCASTRRPPSGKSSTAVTRFTRFHGELMERYVLRLAEDSHQTQEEAGIVRVEGERPYMGKDGSESYTPDVLLSYGTDLVAIEVYGGRPTRKARVLSNPEEMLGMINRVIGKMKELDAALGDVIAGRTGSECFEETLLERVWPVVVIPSSLMQSEFLWNLIEERAPDLFAHHLIQRPSLFGVEDLEVALGAVQDGQGLPAMLAQRLDSVYQRMPPSHFFDAHYRDASRPPYLDAQMRLAGEVSINRLLEDAE